MSIDESDAYSEVSSTELDDIESSEVSAYHWDLRVSTAPARPLNDIEEFRRSSSFLLLERSVTYSSYLIMRYDQKYDLDGEEGQQACKNFLN